jgi:hypothetical protein
MINTHHLGGFNKWILNKILTPEESHVYRKGSHQACTTPEGSNSFIIALQIICKYFNQLRIKILTANVSALPQSCHPGSYPGSALTAY